MKSKWHGNKKGRGLKLRYPFWPHVAENIRRGFGIRIGDNDPWMIW